MKKILIAMSVAAALGTTAAHAQTTATATFDVNLTLTPACIIANSGTTGVVTSFGPLAVAYTAFSGTAGTGSTSFYVRCSGGTSYDIGLDQYSAIVDGTTGLQYNLALKTSNTGNAATAVGGATGQTGAPAGTQWFVQAYVGSGQAGATGGTANNTRTVTVTY